MTRTFKYLHHLSIQLLSVCVRYNTFASKPTHPDEKKRIVSHKGWVSKDKRVNGVLALSRAMGDFKLKEDANGVYHPHNNSLTCMPTVDIWVYNDNLKFVGLFSDGITDVMSDAEILKFIEHMHTSEIRPAQALVQQAYNLKSGDNLTALIIYFVPSHANTKTTTSTKNVKQLLNE